MKTNVLLKAFAATAIAAGIISCEKPNGDSQETQAHEISLTNPADASIFLNNSNDAVFEVALTLKNVTREQLAVTSKNDQTWCAATISGSKDAVVITPGKNETAEDLVATFVVCYAEAPEEASVEFTVTSTGSETEYYINVVSDQLTTDQYGMMSFKPSHAGETLTVTVNTNYERWYLNDMNMVTDDDFNPIEWYTVDKTSGKNGETCTITFSANTGTDDRMTSLMFVEEPEGYGNSITVTQGGVPATKVKVKGYDDNWNKVELASPYEINFSKDASAMDGFDFELEKDGSVSFIFVKPGTTEPDPSIEGADSPWVNISAMYGYSIVPSANTTGAERSADLIITPAGGSQELFRFKIKQAAN